MNFTSPLGPPRPRVIVVDPHTSCAQLVSMLLDREKRFTPVGEASTGVEGLHLFRKSKPDLVITELGLSGLGGPEMIQAIRDECPNARVLIYSGTTNRDLILAGWEARPQGFAHKSEELLLLGQAIAAVASGGSFLTPHTTALVSESQAAAQVKSRLTTKERAVLQLVAEGLSSKQIAERLFISRKTVEHYRALLMQKLELRDIASLTLHAVRCGLVTL